MLKNLIELFRYKELIKTLVGRDLKVRYRNSILGYVWTWLDPLMMMFVFILIFDVLFKSGIQNFPIFLLCGLIPWTFFQSTINTSVSSITSNAGLIKRVYYPREIFPLTTTLSNGVTMSLSFLVLIPVALAFGIPITLKILLFPVTALFLLLFTFGLGLVFSTSNVFMRDTQYIAPFIIRLWFYLTPIFYTVENRVPERVLDIYMVANPMAVLLNLFRASFMNYNLPKPMYIASAVTFSILMFLAGYAFFKKNEDLMVKRI
jgi:ABC-2 type transport system permease protein